MTTANAITNGQGNRLFGDIDINNLTAERIGARRKLDDVNWTVAMQEMPVADLLDDDKYSLLAFYAINHDYQRHALCQVYKGSGAKKLVFSQCGRSIIYFCGKIYEK